jgi:hypothetical protein
MNCHEFYRLSTELNTVVSHCKSLLALQATRYKHFVDGSERGHACTYARLTLRQFHEQQELPTLEQDLTALAHEVEHVLAHVSALAVLDKTTAASAVASAAAVAAAENNL